MSRKTMLALLQIRPGEFVSGGQAAQQLGISRAAVWKTVDALRKDGYTIEARSGLGYRLTAAPNVLTEEAIRSFLRPVDLVGRQLLCCGEIDSTNTQAKKLAISGAPDGTVITADHQTAGRGRLGRSFDSPKGQGVYLTALLRPALAPERLLPFTGLCAAAVCRAVEAVTELRPKIKWTNDLVLHGKKLCGILTEMSLEGETGALQYVVTGIGLNVLQSAEDFSPGVRDAATSVRLESGREVSRAELAAAEIWELDRLYAALQAGETASYLEDYRSRCVTLGKEVQILHPDGSREHVCALDVDDQFGLVVRRDNGQTAVIRSGEASVRGMYGYAE